MPIELKIIGETPQAFWQNAAHAFLLLAQGGNTVFAQPVPADVKGPASTSAESGAPTPVAEAVAEENPPVVEKPKRGRKPSTVITLEATAATNPDLGPPTSVDEDPLGLNDVAKPAEQTYTLDDMRQRVKDIIEAGTKRGNEMPANVAYVRKLFAPFGIRLAAELKPEQFAEFIAASQGYLDGTAK